jgi:hypothetical protein
MAIVNFKNISTSGPGEDALMTATTGDKVINFGKLTTTGDLADGIFAGADGISILNFGGIQTSGLGAAGVLVEGNNARVASFGSITTSGNDDPSGVTSDGIIVFGDAFQVSNFGDVHTTGDFASALVGIGNGGSIFNWGHVDSSSIAAIVIGTVGDAGQVANGGQITVSGSDSSALLTRGDHSSIINWGRVSVTGDLDEAITLQRANSDAHNLGSIVVTAHDGLGMDARGAGHTLDNDGSITVRGSDCIAMAATGGRVSPDGTDLHIVNSGLISIDGTASFGVALGLNLPDPFGPLSASHGLVSNSGIITTHGDGAAAVVLVGDGHEFNNSGTVTANGGTATNEQLGSVRAAGVLVSGNNVSIDNEGSGSIISNHAGSAAIELNVIDRDGVVNAQLSSLVDNFGLIEGVDVAISGGAGQETVVNHGQIIGNVMLGAGDDTFVFGKGGQVVGDVYLGAGNDHVVVERGSGVSHIADLSAHDTVDVSAFFSNFNQLANHIAQNGNDVVVSLDHNDTLVFEHTQLATLQLRDVFLV